MNQNTTKINHWCTQPKLLLVSGCDGQISYTRTQLAGWVTLSGLCAHTEPLLSFGQLRANSFPEVVEARAAGQEPQSWAMMAGVTFPPLVLPQTSCPLVTVGVLPSGDVVDVTWNGGAISCAFTCGNKTYVFEGLGTTNEITCVYTLPAVVIGSYLAKQMCASQGVSNSLGRHSVGSAPMGNSKQKKVVVLERNDGTVAQVSLVSEY
ncbi:hypothetical protein BTVI_47131 [Pitangus sulphuratus]|nr:hypothetical protein BTVI_47131 [Pitangus sulphuratus]